MNAFGFFYQENITVGTQIMNVFHLKRLKTPLTSKSEEISVGLYHKFIINISANTFKYPVLYEPVIFKEECIQVIKVKSFSPKTQL